MYNVDSVNYVPKINVTNVTTQVKTMAKLVTEDSLPTTQEHMSRNT